MSAIAALILALAPVPADPRIAELEQAEAAIAEGHRHPWHSTSESQFAEARAELSRRLSELPPEAARFELAAWIAEIGDGHTLVPLLPLSQEDFCKGSASRFLPLRFEWFDDGLYIVGTDRSFAPMLGKRVTHLGNLDVETALDVAMTALPRRTPGFAREYAPEWLMSEATLIGGGILDSDETLKVQTSHGGIAQVGLVPCHAFDWLHSRTAGPTPSGEWVSLAGPSEDYNGRSLAAFRSQGTAGIRIFELRVDDREKAENLFFDSMMIGSVAKPFLIDLRETVGGDGTLIPAFLAALERRLGSDWPSKVVVLQGRRTHSAGIMLLSALRHRSAKSFGQATGDSPSHYGETEVLRLPAFDSVLLYASRFYDTDHPGDRRPTIEPDQSIPFLFSDFAVDRDRVIEAAVAANGDAP